jgi:manganese transport protein
LTLLTAPPVLPPEHPESPGDRRGSRLRGRFRGAIPLLGPAFVAAIAYVDPGNFATNFGGGAAYGYRLLWVIVAANLTAMLIQILSAKVGLATGSNLAELCRDRFPRPVSRLMWVQAELVAMATDLAEILGGALALNLLFGVPLLTGGLLTAVIAFALLGLQSRGHRQFEVVITGLLGVIALGFIYDILAAPIDPGAAAAGLVPGFAGTDSVLLATGILGATVMPHVIWLHSAMTQQRVPTRNAADRRRVLDYARLDVLIAMGLAGLVNIAMLLVAASLFHRSGLPNLDTIEGVHAGLQRLEGRGTALAFALALLASGLASSSVGTYAGQVVMQGFLRRRVPLLVRRGVTLAPALIVLSLGVDPTRALVLSQVVLSFGIPFALVPLVMFSRRRDLMAELVNRSLTTAAAAVVALLIIGLNAFLLVRTVTG